VIYDGGTGMSEESIRHVEEALAFAQASGIHALDFQIVAWGVWGQLCAGNVAAARVFMQRLVSFGRHTKILDASYRYRVALISLHEGDISQALEEGRKALQLSLDADYVIQVVACHIVVAYIYVRHGDKDKAAEHLAESHRMAVRLRSTLIMGYCAFTEAAILRLWGDHDASLKSLRDALPLMRETGSITPPVCPSDEVATLCAMALDAEIESDYVRDIIKKTHLSPPSGYMSPSWPWSVRIYSMGQFEVFVDDVRVTASDRAQKKPLELLRAIVICGARGVEVQRLTKMLWPNIDEVSAEHSLETLLYRLRKVLGEKAIERHKGQYTLNPEYCWLDVWQIEHLVDCLEHPRERPTKADRLLALYRGPFLDGNDSPSVMLPRERLRSKFMRTLERLGGDAEERGNFESAILYYKKGIEVDPLIEGLYRMLMRCYCLAKCPTEALSVYRRCQTLFVSVLHVEPSAQTKELYEEVKAEIAGHRTSMKERSYR
jgi:DNA-binding SARP family transcriptional activator